MGCARSVRRCLVARGPDYCCAHVLRPWKPGRGAALNSQTTKKPSRAGPLHTSVLEVAVVRPHWDAESQGECKQVHVVRIASRDRPLRGLELGRVLVRFTLAHGQ